MATIRKLFHELGNWHNKISIGAGVTRELFKQKSRKPSSNAMFIKRLTELERLVIGSDKTLHELKDKVYKAIDPDTGKPIVEE
ncbi:MAG: hypothetical protein COS29_02095 [Candidatus Omnitrophica bacterium CG02_land_8_20_14_3_00__42_8]|nr:MAG: hypothetical protein COS29_02095 [Candidatus Omnitrophica bacterium CG02_land_8_20_14_3_00__42_8]PIW68451.1 MAG: hypothetical protein COW10_02500 [Candidatus Omnitrophica bacterium CG12_big_fil_rev_8_21_14_0_65_42_8]